jgi:(2Fe-2S) ferredoxin
MMICPEELWYMKVTKQEVPQIVEEHMKLEAAEASSAAK